MRKDAREVVFKILYSELFVDFNDELFSELSAEFKLNDNEISYAKDLLSDIAAHKGELDGILERYAVNYNLDRIYPTDKCALYIGLAEMTYRADVPNIVAIDEAMALCKKYSTKDSTSFVNGIFAKYKTDLENSQK